MAEPPFSIAGDGQPVFGAMVKVLKDGRIFLCVDTGDEDNWTTCTVSGENATVLAVRLEEIVGKYSV
jgi:hypothetical protein